MARFCQQFIDPTIDEVAYCQALLNNNCLFWVSMNLVLWFVYWKILKDDENVFKRRKRGFHLPPDDFVYGLKHPKQDGITGVAAGQNEMNTRKIFPIIVLQLFNIIQSLFIH